MLLQMAAWGHYYSKKQAELSTFSHFFKMWTIFKVFIEFITILLLFLHFGLLAERREISAPCEGLKLCLLH